MRISDWSSDVCSSDLSDSAAPFLANSHGPAWMAEATRNAKIPLIHLSTDYVFDGSKTTAYSEDDETVPLGVYGASKRASELAVISVNPQSIRSDEHTSDLQSLIRISYAVFCLNTKNASHINSIFV